MTQDLVQRAFPQRRGSSRECSEQHERSNNSACVTSNVIGNNSKTSPSETLPSITMVTFVRARLAVVAGVQVQTVRYSSALTTYHAGRAHRLCSWDKHIWWDGKVKQAVHSSIGTRFVLFFLCRGNSLRGGSTD